MDETTRGSAPHSPLPVGAKLVFAQVLGANTGQLRWPRFAPTEPYRMVGANLGDSDRPCVRPLFPRGVRGEHGVRPYGTVQIRRHSPVTRTMRCLPCF